MKLLNAGHCETEWYAVSGSTHLSNRAAESWRLIVFTGSLQCPVLTPATNLKSLRLILKASKDWMWSDAPRTGVEAMAVRTELPSSTGGMCSIFKPELGLEFGQPSFRLCTTKSGITICAGRVISLVITGHPRMACIC